MNCQEIQECLTDYSAGVLSRREMQRIEEHLAHCSDCQREWDVLQRVIDLVEATPRLEATPGLWSRIESRLDTALELPRPWWQRIRDRYIQIPRAVRRSLVAGALATAALAFVLLGGIRREAPAPAPLALSPYLKQHLIMAENEPFADRAGLGALVAVTFRGER